MIGVDVGEGWPWVELECVTGLMVGMIGTVVMAVGERRGGFDRIVGKLGHGVTMMSRWSR